MLRQKFCTLGKHTLLLEVTNIRSSYARNTKHENLQSNRGGKTGTRRTRTSADSGPPGAPSHRLTLKGTSRTQRRRHEGQGRMGAEILNQTSRLLVDCWRPPHPPRPGAGNRPVSGALQLPFCRLTELRSLSVYAATHGTLSNMTSSKYPGTPAEKEFPRRWCDEA